MGEKFKLGIILFCLGFAGIVSMLTVTISMEGIPPEVMQEFSPDQLRLLFLINPTLLLLLSVVIGTRTYKKAGLSVPLISSIIDKNHPQKVFLGQLKPGTILGIITGLLLVLISEMFQKWFPEIFIMTGENIDLTPLARILYGGITEEILIRFGLMTLLVWIINRLSGSLANGVYFAGILLASFLFAIGHFPVVFTSIANPPAVLLTYVFLGNTVAGVFYGWLYWRKGLEAAFIAHIVTHLVMMALA